VRFATPYISIILLQVFVILYRIAQSLIIANIIIPLIIYAITVEIIAYLANLMNHSHIMFVSNVLKIISLIPLIMNVRLNQFAMIANITISVIIHAQFAQVIAQIAP
jgi:hypothetical protein